MNYPEAYRRLMKNERSLLLWTALWNDGYTITSIHLINGSIIFALGTMITGPVLMDVITLLAPPKLIASYYGFNGYSTAIGGVMSMIVRGWLYDLGIRNG
ncbi:MAG: arabinose transporter permease [Paenibacillus sp.]|jgi:DHA1 family multidrug resistance protein-like MFS transporter|nr:arabinose transporter permease [Paenibacillus sp.]